MKRISVLLLSAFLLTFIYSCNPVTNEENKVNDTSYPLISQPVHIGYYPGHFTISGTTGIFCPVKLEETAGIGVKQVGLKNQVNTGRKRNGIFLAIDTSLHREGYILKIGSRKIEITGGSNSGVFYALQTLHQLSGSGGLPSEVPCVAISDFPAFSWRGLMLDCSRTFQSPGYLKKTIDRML